MISEQAREPRQSDSKSPAILIECLILPVTVSKGERQQALCIYQQWHHSPWSLLFLLILHPALTGWRHSSEALSLPHTLPSEWL